MVLFAPALTLAVVMLALVANGVLAVSFAVSGIPFKLNADELDGSNFTQIGMLNGVNSCDASNDVQAVGSLAVLGAAIVNNTNYPTLLLAPVPPSTSIAAIAQGQAFTIDLGHSDAFVATASSAVPAFSGPAEAVPVNTVRSQNNYAVGTPVLLSSNGANCLGGKQFTATTLLDSATIYNLSQTVCSDIPIFTGLTGLRGMLTLSAGDNSGIPGRQPSASSLIVDATSLQGASAAFTNINIGEDFAVPDSILQGGAGNPGHGSHTFSQQATHVTITGLKQNGTDTAAASFTLPNLSLGASLVGSCP